MNRMCEPSEPQASQWNHTHTRPCRRYDLLLVALTVALPFLRSRLVLDQSEGDLAPE